MLSDHNAEVVQRLAANIELNRASLLRSCAHVSAENLDWRDFLVGSTVLGAAPTLRFEVSDASWRWQTTTGTS